MKISLKNKGNLIIANILLITFFLLHYFIFMNNSSSKVYFIQSFTDAPINLQELVLCEEIKPNYINPFRKVQFSYQVEQNGVYTECNIVERAESIFTSKMKPLSGNVYDYYDGFDEDGFVRPQVAYTYANLLFFVIQYIIAIIFIFILLKPIKPEKLK